MSWAETINNFFDQKIRDAEEKWLNESIFKEIKGKKFFNNEDLKKIFSPRSEFTARGKFEELEKHEHILNGICLNTVKTDHRQKLVELSEKFNQKKCIDEYSQNAGQVSFATHVAKLTHSKIDSPSFLDTIYSKKNSYCSTSSLKNKSIDGAVSGNQYAPIYQFLELEFNEKKLAEAIAEENFREFDSFAECEETAQRWIEGFRQALGSGSVRGHFLLKQVYFPIESEKYHLLCNVQSSSLAQSLHEKCDDRESGSRKQKEKNKYHIESHSHFWNKGILKVTASNHGNASQLNGKRGGRLTLLNTQPPTWNSQLNPSHFKKSFLDEYAINQSTKEDVEYLRDFLIRFQNLDLSIKNPDRFKWIEMWIRNIIEEILFYAANIQKNLVSGWSASEGLWLKLEHQYFLDPYRKDDAYQSACRSTDWQSTICKDFAKWLNRQLIGKDKKFTPQKEHERLWIKLMETPLREHCEMMEMS